MKELIIFRHGKTDWNADFAKDFDRPLNDRGVKASQKMGEFLQNANEVPPIILCSPAVRTVKTLEVAASSGQWDSEVQYDESLYMTNVQTALSKINSLDNAYDSAMLVNHQPICSQFTGLLIGDGNVMFKTATMAKIVFDTVTWANVTYGEGELKWLVPPKLLL